VQMVRWVSELTGLDEMDAYQLVAQTALTPVANVCDTVYTMVCKVAKDHLPGAKPMNDTHGRLRRVAAEWLESRT